MLELNRVARELTWGRPVQMGQTGHDVKRVQEWLTLHGFALTPDGEFGSATRAQATRWRRTLPGDSDPAGMLSIPVLERLSQPLRRAFSFEAETKTLREGVVAVAMAHLAVHPREAGGDNRGPWVRAYCGADGAEYRWCAGGALSVVMQAAKMRDEAMPIPFTLSCDEIASAARKDNRLTRNPRGVKAGDLFLVRRTETDWIHVGIVTAMHADHFETWEGNTNDDGSSNGFEVCARVRDLRNKDFVLLG